MKTLIAYLGKLIISGILAVLILSGFCLIYDNSPIAIEQPDQYTNYKFRSDTTWSYMIEGFGFGRTNNIGYNSAYDVAYTDPVIAFLGSSQTEALQVTQNNNFVSLVQEQLANDSDINNDYPCVNLGISSHFFNVCTSKFSSFLDVYENAKFAVIETGNLAFSGEELNKMLEEAYHNPYQDKGMIINALRYIPVIRTLKTQFERTLQTVSSAGTHEEIHHDYEVYEHKMQSLMQKLATAAAEKDLQIIILYHNLISVDADNMPIRKDDTQLLEIFRKCCMDNGISFIDATEKFLDHYRETYQMPYGFANTKPGDGHLNKTGHSIIAELVYNRINEML